ncbi:MAG: flagellar motor switch protein FliM [Thermodesulfobacteriota bacterium]|nr:flagellar motor switch protein FliM [Thermodesulfobacteriota bacterium]
MSQILSQDEVDALLKSVAGGEVDTDVSVDGGAKGEINSYDFTAQDKIVRGRMPTLEVINDRFARFFRNALSTMLRRMVNVTPVSLDMLKFSDFMRSLPVPSGIHIIRVEPLRGNALVVLETKLVFALVDCFFGGRGTSGIKVEGREFTAIEQKILHKVVDAVIKEWANAWRPVHDIRFSYVRGEMNPQFAGIIPNEDILITIQFEVEMEETTGNMVLCMPYMILEPLREKLYATFQTEEKVDVDTDWLSRLKEELLKVYADLVVELGSTRVTGRDLALLKAGDVILLDKDVDDLLLVKVQSIPKFYAKLGKVGETMAVQMAGVVNK